jgi:hypothetical protein
VLIPINGLDIPTPVRQTVRATHRKPETSLIRGDPSQSLPIPHATGEGSGAIPEPQRFWIANGSAGVERFMIAISMRQGTSETKGCECSPPDRRRAETLGERL